MTRETDPLLSEIVAVLKKDPSRMFSREEILNLLSHRKRDRDVEHLLADLEVSSSGIVGSGSDVYATCRGGTVYYKWNRS